MKLSTRDYLDTLKEAVGQGHACSMLITGGSMEPFLVGGRDTIRFAAPKEKLRRGDMVFFQRESGQYVMHRIRWVKEDGLYIIGDNQTETEGPVDPSRVFAVVFEVKRNGKILTPKSFWWRFFRTVWLRIIPLRHKLMGAYRKLHRS